MATLTFILLVATFPSMSKPLSSDSHGVRVKVLRENLGISQGELGRRSWLAPSTVCAIEHGRNKASSADTQDALARGLGLTLSDLRSYLRGELTVSGAIGKARLS